MLILIILLFATSCQAAVDFSSRPTNSSIIMLYFTHKASETSVVLGPYGIWSLMAGLSFGAVGDTGREIFRSFLLLTDKTKFNRQYKDLSNTVFKVKSNGVTVSNKNYLFVDTNFLIEQDFKNMLIDDYETEYKLLDFKDIYTSANIANSLITEHSPPVNNVYRANDFKDSSLIMCNVFFFKALWSTPFNVTETVSELIFTSDRNNVDVNMMNKRMQIPYSHIDEMKATIMELSLGEDNKYCMLILTPDPNTSVQEVYKNFVSVTFKHIFNILQKDIAESGLKEVDIKLPRFAKTSKVNLERPLNDMGVYNAFDPTNARFQRMAREPIYIGAVEHNAFITVTESGIIAYAMTPGVNSDLKSPNDEPIIMPPLIFFIMEKPTTTILFGGIFP